MINHKYKFVFVAIPKTATTSIHYHFLGSDVDNSSVNLDLMTGHGLQHSSYPKILQKSIIDVSGYFSFSFTRNPWDRLVSAWKYLTTSHRSKETFDEFFDRFFMPPFERMGIHLFPQHQFILDQNGENLVDFIGSFENLQQDFDIICDKIGTPRQRLSHKNQRIRKHYSSYYNDEMRELVAKKYSKDIKYFGYKFEERDI